MRYLHTFAVPALAVLLAGCGDDKRQIAFERQIQIERQARDEAVRRESDAARLAQREQSKREFWQGAAYTSALLAVVLLLAGTAIGSRAKARCHDESAKQ